MCLQDNYTALHLAVQSGKSSVVEALLGHGAQVITLLYFVLLTDQGVARLSYKKGCNSLLKSESGSNSVPEYSSKHLHSQTTRHSQNCDKAIP